MASCQMATTFPGNIFGAGLEEELENGKPWSDTGFVTPPGLGNSVWPFLVDSKVSTMRPRRTSGSGGTDSCRRRDIEVLHFPAHWATLRCSH